jgi:hypothetical protein
LQALEEDLLDADLLDAGKAPSVKIATPSAKIAAAPARAPAVGETANRPAPQPIRAKPQKTAEELELEELQMELAS